MSNLIQLPNQNPYKDQCLTLLQNLENKVNNGEVLSIFAVCEEKQIISSAWTGCKDQDRMIGSILRTLIKYSNDINQRE